VGRASRPSMGERGKMGETKPRSNLARPFDSVSDIRTIDHPLTEIRTVNPGVEQSHILRACDKA
jgi:hypothetical protein